MLRALPRHRGRRKTDVLFGRRQLHVERRSCSLRCRRIAPSAEHAGDCAPRIPLLFAGQQFAEGLLWLALSQNGGDVLRIASTQAFLALAEVVWPIFAPLSVYFVEADEKRRRRLLILVIYGAAVAVALLIGMVAWPYDASVVGLSISYARDLAAPRWSVLPYLASVSLPFLISSHRLLNIFGLVLIAAFVVTAILFAAVFLSIWCFFAAGLSAVIVLFSLTAERRAAGSIPGSARGARGL